MGKLEKKGKGSFCVPLRAIQEMWKNKVDVNTLLAYLILSAFTDEHGTSSRAGAKAIIERLGLRKELAEEAIATLVGINLLIDHRGATGSRIQDPNAVRFTVPDFGEALQQRIWFGMSIVETNVVDGVLLCRPMRALKNATIECIYLLLWMHSIQDPHYLSASPPIPARNQRGIFVRYGFDREHDSTDCHASHRIQIANSPQVEWTGLPFSEDVVVASLKYLKIHGFVYEVIMAFNRQLVPLSDSSEKTYLDAAADPIFHLHCKLRKEVLPAEEIGVSHLTLKIGQARGYEVFDKDGKADNRFFVISQPGTDLGVAGLFRLRHRVRNAANHGVGEPWARLMDSENEYRDWLGELLADQYCVNVENLAQHKKSKEKRAQKDVRNVGRSKRANAKQGFQL